MTVKAYHHFTLTDEIIAASHPEEVHATVRDMEEFGLCHLPYPECIVSFRAAAILNHKGAWFKQDEPDVLDAVIVSALLYDQITWSHPESWKPGDVPRPLPQFRGHPEILMTHDTGQQVVMDVITGASSRGLVPNTVEFCKASQDLLAHAAVILVASLASSNVDKQTCVNKRAARGIGNGKFKGADGIIYLSTTTLRPPSFPTGTGISPRPHMRRGHKHTFLTGVGRTERIVKFVGPVFVNGADAIGPAPTHEYVVQGRIP